MFGKILVIAPHLDDETIGVGGTIKKLIELRFNIQILIVGGHLPPLYSKKNYEITKKYFKVSKGGEAPSQTIKFNEQYINHFRNVNLS